MADRLTPEDLPRIRNALQAFRDELIRHVQEKRPWGNFEGNRALEQALKEPATLEKEPADKKEPAKYKDVPQHLPSDMKYEPTNIFESVGLPRDLQNALAEVWRRRMQVVTKAQRVRLLDAIDRALEFISKPDAHLDELLALLSKGEGRLLTYLWTNPVVKRSKLHLTVWHGKSVTDQAIDKAVQRLNNRLAELPGFDYLSVEVCGEHIKLLHDK